MRIENLESKASMKYEDEMPTDPRVDSNAIRNPRIIVFSHLLAYLESFKANPIAKTECLTIGRDKINLEVLRRVHNAVQKFLRLY